MKQEGRPVIGLMCGNEVANRPIQAVATRFVDPLVQLCGASVVIVPAVPEAVDTTLMADMLDGLLLTGGRSHVAPVQYGGCAELAPQACDPQRDSVALALAGRMIERGKAVFGICRGMQEINVLFGGSLTCLGGRPRHHRGSWEGDYDTLFGHHHPVDLMPGGALAGRSGHRRVEVNSVHQQGVDRLGYGLVVEARDAEDGLIEAFRAPGCGADVLAVQWHPEWDIATCGVARGFFTLLGESVGGRA
ncbi:MULTISPECIES: gamma-glutamyl-gamma-aminobutyrate hydrolase family protein [Sphingomonas]|jgi:putative glutamine amidotransferase|uniref:gamma-glutamyl-gamma-aminobutyrate hydrolase family protein n=1 Tax=Sphingomonas TaxID=13687 RepID=UPI001585CB6B|nr:MULTISPECIES: gamma-glutamyl-gamma-aminobutyrate hydrolase family protein [Sphingomonas]MBB4048559.1 putative glutamine amidotransferase [Sphingomonas zeae]MDK8186547.1 gamma-glutamyl-gamma-aminobutyrate hydrolase family protein [Sphingomonas zeae]MDK8216206.1 gamma-glutamyl-gamma-aminobutyrate hydrolase family protein [Sphingomonas sp. UMB7805-LC452B]